MREARKFELVKETKNTVRYEEVVPTDGNPIVGTVYVQKTALPSDHPETITVTVET